MIIGISVGTVAVVFVIIILLIYFFVIQKKKKKSRNDNDVSDEYTYTNCYYDEEEDIDPDV